MLLGMVLILLIYLDLIFILVRGITIDIFIIRLRVIKQLLLAFVLVRLLSLSILFILLINALLFYLLKLKYGISGNSCLVIQSFSSLLRLILRLWLLSEYVLTVLGSRALIVLFSGEML